jgi:hypothetical protein
MADEEGTRSLVDERPEIVVHIPEAEERPQAPPIVIGDRQVPWIQRIEAPWVILAAVVVLIALLLFVPSQTVDVTAAPEGGSTGAAIAAEPSWTALAIPVPESDRTLTVNVDGSVDVLQVAALGFDAADPYLGNVATADGPTVQQVFSPQAFTISSPTGATVVAFMPYQATGTPNVDPGEQLTFVGTVMPVPIDFSAMVGSEAASIGAASGVYVSIVPETVATVVTAP